MCFANLGQIAIYIDLTGQGDSLAHFGNNFRRAFSRAFSRAFFFSWVHFGSHFRGRNSQSEWGARLAGKIEQVVANVRFYICAMSWHIRKKKP